MIHTLLIVDDNILDNAKIRNLLYNEKFNLLSAINGQEALDFIESRNIDLILLDIIMPVMDGFEFLELFSKTVYSKHIPIIVTTNLSDNESINKILSYNNIFDYIIKPIDKLNNKILINKIKTGISYRKLLSNI